MIACTGQCFRHCNHVSFNLFSTWAHRLDLHIMSLCDDMVRNIAWSWRSSQTSKRKHEMEIYSCGWSSRWSTVCDEKWRIYQKSMAAVSQQLAMKMRPSCMLCIVCQVPCQWAVHRISLFTPSATRCADTAESACKCVLSARICTWPWGVGDVDFNLDSLEGLRSPAKASLQASPTAWIGPLEPSYRRLTSERLCTSTTVPAVEVRAAHEVPHLYILTDLTSSIPSRCDDMV